MTNPGLGLCIREVCVNEDNVVTTVEVSRMYKDSMETVDVVLAVLVGSTNSELVQVQTVREFKSNNGISTKCRKCLPVVDLDHCVLVRLILESH